MASPSTGLISTACSLSNCNKEWLSWEQALDVVQISESLPSPHPSSFPSFLVFLFFPPGSAGTRSGGACVLAATNQGCRSQPGSNTLTFKMRTWPCEVRRLGWLGTRHTYFPLQYVPQRLVYSYVEAQCETPEMLFMWGQGLGNKKWKCGPWESAPPPTQGWCSITAGPGRLKLLPAQAAVSGRSRGHILLASA